MTVRPILSLVVLIKHKLIILPLRRLVGQTKSTAACTHVKLHECDLSIDIISMGLVYNYTWQFSESVLQVCESHRSRVYFTHERIIKASVTCTLYHYHKFKQGKQMYSMHYFSSAAVDAVPPSQV